MKKIILMFPLLISACYNVPVQQVTPIVTETTTDKTLNDIFKECINTDKGSILWYEHFVDEVISRMEDRYDAVRRMCAPAIPDSVDTRTTKQKMFDKYQSDMSDKCKPVIKESLQKLMEIC